MDEQIAAERDGHLFHDDSYGRYFYKNHRDYLMHIKTYLMKCSKCLDYLYPEQSRTIIVGVTRIGTQDIHLECYDG